MQHEWIDDLRGAVEHLGTTVVARRMGCSPATIHQICRNQYNTGTLGKWQARFEAEFGEGQLACPVLGEIDRSECKRHRVRPFGATNPVRVQLYHACRTCTNNPDREEL